MLPASVIGCTPLIEFDFLLCASCLLLLLWYVLGNVGVYGIRCVARVVLVFKTSQGLPVCSKPLYRMFIALESRYISVAYRVYGCCKTS